LAVVACGSQPEPEEPSLPPAPRVVVADAAVVADATAPTAPPWTFIVVSDIHLPNPKRAVIDKMFATIIEMKPRFVVVAGDSTNGNPTDPPALVAGSTHWWKVVTEALTPLRDAKIAVLPVAGNHDSYLPGQRQRYAANFDLASWAPGIEIHAGDKNLAKAPFTYSVDVDGIHLALIHVVSQQLDKDVASWLAADLDAAKTAKARIVVSHVPWHAVITRQRPAFVDALGTVLEAGHATMYIGGHEHMVWDEDFALPHGGTLREVHVGCISGWYNYGPVKDAMTRAHCAATKIDGKREPYRCEMPHGGGAFVISRERHNRFNEHALATFTVVTVDGDKVEATPMTVDADGKPIPFYLTEAANPTP
jgi:predicted phosphodiesterase